MFCVYVGGSQRLEQTGVGMPSLKATAIVQGRAGKIMTWENESGKDKEALMVQVTLGLNTMRNLEELRKRDKFRFNKKTKIVYLNVMNFVCAHVQQVSETCSLRAGICFIHFRCSTMQSIYLFVHSFIHPFNPY